ncbi:MAG: SUMF1/EgtB/PvdO family nonheme iron enzyme [Phycisphaeraceae bacterium]|nr:SUMF1/EgtB/PvdO family nonheme iron enzyme [Phycisphaeraceae bacterium]
MRPASDYHDDRLVELFHRLCDEDPDSWASSVALAGLDGDASSELLGLLRAQRSPLPILDRSPAEAFPELSRGEPAAFDGYEIIRLIGSGGMGLVYLAEEVNLKRLVAIKALPASLTGSASAVERFRHEAQAAASLEHENIVRVHRFGRWGETHYIASQYIEGQTLAEAIARAKTEGPNGDWPAWSVGAIRSIASALESAHAQGVIHRDVKPANILINREGVAFLADFGVAKTSGSLELTRTAEKPGTIAYMSPEQAGLLRAPVGARSDVYALGAVLYECLTLEKLHPEGSAAEALNAMRARSLRPVRVRGGSSSEQLRRVCERALAWDPRDRFGSAGEFAEELDRILRGEPVRTRRMPATRRLRLLLRRRSAWIVIAASLLLGVAGVVAPILLPEPQPTGLLTVRSDAPGSRISVRRYDWDSRQYGPETPIGTGPASRRLPQGQYRVLVRAPGALAECNSVIGEDASVEIDAHPRPMDPESAGMVLIPGGPAIVGFKQSIQPKDLERTVQLPPFWIDRCEVSNAQYREYVEATGAAAPPLWVTPYDHAIDRLPVVGVTFAQAEAYAQWAGKRLPSAVEWERAARGPEGWYFPWGFDYEAVQDRGNIGQDSRLGWQSNFDDPEFGAQVLAPLRPVDDPIGADVTPDGLIHMFGNISEYTDSPFEWYQLDEAPGQYEYIQVKGRPWNGENGPTMDLTSVVPFSRRQQAACVGFRCARSVDE